MTAAALYLRVSTDEQKVENQRADLERLASVRGFDIRSTFDETVSGIAKSRPALDAMLLAAHRGEFRVVLVWALDRLGRSMYGMIATVLELDRLGVRVVSFSESWLDTGGPVRQLLLAIFSWQAEQERARLVERTRAGLARARREGKRLGRRPTQLDLDQALELRAAGRSIRAVAAELKVAPSIVHRALSVPAGGLCSVCSAEVHLDLHGRARWHLEPGRELCQGTGHAALPLPSNAVPKTSPDPDSEAA